MDSPQQKPFLFQTKQNNSYITIKLLKCITYNFKVIEILD